MSLKFGSGQLTHPPPPNLCIINMRIFCFPTLHTHFLLQQKTSLCCRNIWLELCFWVLTFFIDEKFTLIKRSLCWKPKLVKDHLTDHSPSTLYSIIHNLQFPIEQPWSTVKPLQRSENWCLVDYDYSCMIPGQNMPSCKSFLLNEHNNYYLLGTRSEQVSSPSQNNGCWLLLVSVKAHVENVSFNDSITTRRWEDQWHGLNVTFFAAQIM